MSADLATVTYEGCTRVRAQSEKLERQSERHHTVRERGESREQVEEDARKVFREWTKVAEQELDVVSKLCSSNRNVIEINEADSLWELLEQIRLDIVRYVEAPDSVLAVYEPLKRAAAPQTLIRFWGNWQTVFDILGAYRDTLRIYIDVCRQQPISEVRKFERDRRVDSGEIRSKLSEFVMTAKPLMQALRKL